MPDRFLRWNVPAAGLQASSAHQQYSPYPQTNPPTDPAPESRAPVQIDSLSDAQRVAAASEKNCSPLYRPPELYEPPVRGTLDSRVDVWALGCMLYFMMMRVNPFERQCLQGASLVLAVQRCGHACMGCMSSLSSTCCPCAFRLPAVAG